MTLDVKVDVSQLVNLSETVEKTPNEIGKRIVTSINVVANKMLVNSKKMIVAQVNLTGDKVDSKMTIEPATESNLTSIITARGRGTLLVNFGAKQIIKTASSRSKSGSKNAGVSVNIKPSGVAGVIEHGFFMRLKNSGAIGVFTRDQSGKLRIRYGPSVDQVFKGVSTELAPQVEIDLQKELLAEFDQMEIST